MSIKHAILGLLSWQPLSGYDLKKRISESSTFYWSGNNNQIYKTLVQLLEEKLVTFENQYQEKGPAKKVYTITGAGQDELRQWVLSTPQPPEIRNTFLIQLAWAEALTAPELDDLIRRYTEEVHTLLVMHEEKLRRGSSAPNRSPREAFIWKMISENVTASLKTELSWVHKLRQGLNSHQEVQPGETKDELSGR